MRCDGARYRWRRGTEAMGGTRAGTNHLRPRHFRTPSKGTAMARNMRAPFDAMKGLDHMGREAGCAHDRRCSPGPMADAAHTAHAAHAGGGRGWALQPKPTATQWPDAGTAQDVNKCERAKHGWPFKPGKPTSWFNLRYDRHGRPGDQRMSLPSTQHGGRCPHPPPVDGSWTASHPHWPAWFPGTGLRMEHAAPRRAPAPPPAWSPGAA